MLSQNVAKTTVPSANHYRFEMPQPAYVNQWRGVYYFAGLSKIAARHILLARKRFVLAQNADFNRATQTLLAAAKGMLASLPAEEVIRQRKYEFASRARQLHAHGLLEEGTQLFDVLHDARALNSGDYAGVIHSLSAPALQRVLLATDANFDMTLALKLLADRRGGDRFNEAQRVFSCCEALFPVGAQGGCGGLGIHHVNELMGVALTCGFSAMRSVHGVMYDQLLELRIAPTVDTYRSVFLSLGLEGKVDEAAAVLNFLRCHHSDQLDISFYNAAMTVYRENHLYDECDALWEQLVDSRSPLPDVETAEVYLRSIIDRSYRKSSENMAKWGELAIVEKKRVPQVLQQLERLGIPRAHLSTPLLLEVEDALRKFMIPKGRFYEWGRATKLFAYIEARRKYGWLYDIKEMNPTRFHAPLFRNPDQMGQVVGPSGSVELPAWHGERDSWMVPPLQSVLNRIDVTERMDGARNGEVFFEDKKPIHERSASWMLESPQTRFDQLYGLNNPDIPKVGIRRHLGGEYLSEEELARRDSSLLRQALSSGRRLKKKSVRERTHRIAAE